MRKLTLLLALALAACGGSSSSPKPKVAIFLDTDYVDYTDGDTEAEGYNMLQALAAMPDVTATPCVSADVETVLAGKNVFVLPEQENGSLVGDMGDSGLALMYSFVHDRGGTLILGGNYYQSGLDVVNEAFGFSIQVVPQVEDLVAAVAPSISLTAAAAGTPFQGGVATLEEENGTYYMDATTVPEAAKVIYADDANNAAVVVIPVGSGRIILLAYDYYDAAPAGSQDGGWVEIFDTAVHYL